LELEEPGIYSSVRLTSRNSFSRYPHTSLEPVPFFLYTPYQILLHNKGIYLFAKMASQMPANGSSSDIEKDAAVVTKVDETSGHSEPTTGGVLQRDLKNRHMQMIAIGTFQDTYLADPRKLTDVFS
jgi:hypothetical protein